MMNETDSILLASDDLLELSATQKLYTLNLKLLKALDSIPEDVWYSKNATVWKICLFILLNGVPQPSPFVLALAAAACVFQQSWWTAIYDSLELNTDEGERFLFLYLPPVVITTLYWVNGLLLLWLEYSIPEKLDWF